MQNTLEHNLCYLEKINTIPFHTKVHILRHIRTLTYGPVHKNQLQFLWLQTEVSSVPLSSSSPPLAN